MTNFAPFLPTAARRRSLSACLLLTATLLLAFAALMVYGPTSAHAVVTEVSGTKVGLQSRTEILGLEDMEEPARKEAEESFANNEGNAILHGTNIYTVYWDPGNVFQQEWIKNLDGFFQELGGGSGGLGTIFSPLGQYRDRSNTGATYQTTFMGSYSDTTKYPTPVCTDPQPLAVGAITCLTDAQLREQLESFIAYHGTPKGMHTIYYLLTPPGVTVCLDAASTHCSDFTGAREAGNESYAHSFCSYHGDINPDNATEGDTNTVLYAAIPWTAAGTFGLFNAKAESQPHVHGYDAGYDCQDGGWSPADHEENLEVPKEQTTSEIEAYEKATPKEKAKLKLERELEGPHQEEPNQEGQTARGDYGAGLTDLLVNQIAEEQANTVTDPLLNAWQNSEKLEATDVCRDVFDNTAGPTGGSIGGSVIADERTFSGSLENEEIGGGSYYINNVWSLGTHHCVGGVGLEAHFTLPDPVNNNELIGLDGMESTVDLAEGKAFGPTGSPTTTYATYSWNFGDGTPEVKGFAPGAPPCEAPWASPCAGSTFHSYQYGGTYKVTLTVTDVAGNTTSESQELVVHGPLAPTPPAAPATTTSTAPVLTGPTIVKPVAKAAFLSRSLKSALRKGLSIRYSVNEQVAGHFDVLISAALAKKLHLHGTPATGLPAGTQPEVMIAHEVLVTTKAGTNTVKIKFAKSVVARLRNVHSIPLLLQMYVRDAASKSPATATVLTAVTLAH